VAPDQPSRSLDSLSTAIAETRARLGTHELYTAIRTLPALRVFVEHHVVCVLDFMSLLKSLQRELTCVAIPWVPTADPEAARLIQRIVLDEETDVRDDGRVMSHFAWYLDAMEEIGADAGPARRMVAALASGTPLREALRASALPPAARMFGGTTADLLELPLPARAAAFFRGREELIPAMFLPILDRLERQGLCCPLLKGYLQRHIQVDGDDHGPQAKRILDRLCRDSATSREEAEDAALMALTARDRLWDGIVLAACTSARYGA
jgi:hypothetical protein